MQLDLDRSKTVDATFYQMPNDWTVKIDSKYNRQYSGGGDEGLIDGIRGTLNFASGEWQGYQPHDLVATIDLQKETKVTKLGGGLSATKWLASLRAMSRAVPGCLAKASRQSSPVCIPRSG